jgi:hypothetical protein
MSRSQLSSAQHLRLFPSCLQRTDRLLDSITRRDHFSIVQSPEENRVVALEFRNLLGQAADYRTLCITEKGYLGLFPLCCKPGDEIILLSGGKTPYLVRKTQRESWNFLGDCFVHGYMNGEAWSQENAMESFVFV